MAKANYVSISKIEIYSVLQKIKKMRDKYDDFFGYNSYQDLIFKQSSDGFTIHYTIDFNKIESELNKLQGKALSGAFYGKSKLHRAEHIVPSQYYWYTNNDEFIKTIEPSLIGTTEALKKELLSKLHELYDSLDTISVLHTEYLNKKITEELPAVINEMRELVLTQFKKHYEHDLMPFFNGGIQEINIREFN